MPKDKVLVVDDEPHILHLLRANLTVEGYEVLVAEDGRQALEILKDQTPDLMILDLMLPGWMAMRWRGGRANSQPYPSSCSPRAAAK